MMTEEIEVVEPTNRCKADTVRRQRAAADDTITEQLGNGLRRMIRFQVGYDHTKFPEDCGGGGHGLHGMTMFFILAGPHGGVQWSVNLPNWIPGNFDIMDQVRPVIPISAVGRVIGDGMPTDLGYHSPKPMYEDHTQFKCDLLPDGYCYYDGSGLNAGPVLRAFLEHGPHAVWATLARYYQEVLT